MSRISIHLNCITEREARAFLNSSHAFCINILALIALVFTIFVVPDMKKPLYLSKIASWQHFFANHANYGIDINFTLTFGCSFTWLHDAIAKHAHGIV